MNIIKISINGSSGKMGKALINIINNSDEFTLKHSITSSSSNYDRKNSLVESDVLIDYSSNEGVELLLNNYHNENCKLLIGTTNLSVNTLAKLKEIADKVAILIAPNTSITANLAAKFSRIAAKILSDYDCEIIDYHHNRKKDAPSGTALMIGEAIAAARCTQLDEIALFDKFNDYKYNPGMIGFSSIRAGDIAGEHDIIFAGDDEIIKLNIRANSRDAFAKGALLAAKWLSNQAPGLYYMNDFLELNNLKY